MRRCATTAVLLGLVLGGCGAEATVPTGYQGIVEYDERTLGFEVAGRLEHLAVHEGFELIAGDEIGRLDPTLETLARDAQQAQVAVAQASLALLQAGSRPEDVRAARASLDSARAAEALADKNLRREQELSGTDVARPADLDAAVTADSEAKARRQQLSQQLARVLHGARAEEIDVAEAQAEAARLAVSSYDERIKRHTLRTEHTGYVLEVLRKEGEFLGVGAPVVTMADVSRPYVDAFVPQGHMTEVRQNAPASVRIDATGETFPGQVEIIGRRTEFTPKFLFSDRERPNLVVRVRVRITDPDHKLRAGVPAFVRFEAGSVP